MGAKRDWLWLFVQWSKVVQPLAAVSSLHHYPTGLLQGPLWDGRSTLFMGVSKKEVMQRFLKFLYGTAIVLCCETKSYH